MKCTACGARLDVRETANIANHLVVWRRRVCRHCHKHFFTWESFTPIHGYQHSSEQFFQSFLANNPDKAEALIFAMTQASMRFAAALDRLSPPKGDQSQQDILEALDTLLREGADDTLAQLRKGQTTPVARERLWRLRCLIEDFAHALDLL